MLWGLSITSSVTIILRRTGRQWHEVGIVGQRHLFRVDGPTAVRVENLAVVGIGIGCPVLGVDEVRAFERFLLVIFYASVADEARVSS